MITKWLCSRPKICSSVRQHHYSNKALGKGMCKRSDLAETKMLPRRRDNSHGRIVEIPNDEFILKASQATIQPLKRCFKPRHKFCR